MTRTSTSMRPGRADAHEGAGLEHAQQLDLQLERHLGDLVEEQRAAVGALEVALVLPVGAGEAAPLVAEQLALDQVRRDRAAVDGEERAASRRRLRSWTVCATSSLPVPLSPMMNTVTAVPATRAISS